MIDFRISYLVVSLLLCVHLVDVSCNKTPTPKKLCKRLDDIYKMDRIKEGKKQETKAEARENFKDCVKKMTYIRKKSKECYKCIVGCSQKASGEDAAMCTVGCLVTHEIKFANKDSISDERRRSIIEDDSAACKQDWIKATLKPVVDKVSGHTFRLSLPPNLVRKEKSDSPSDIIVKYERKHNNVTCGPYFWIRAFDRPPPTVEMFLEWYPSSKYVVHTKKLPQGFIIISNEDEFSYMLEVIVYLMTKTGKSILLSLFYSYDQFAKDVAKHRKWMEKVALTFQAL